MITKKKTNLYIGYVYNLRFTYPVTFLGNENRNPWHQLSAQHEAEREVQHLLFPSISPVIFKCQYSSVTSTKYEIKTQKD